MIWQSIQNVAEEGKRAALVTVIGINGSTPRSSGAKMIVFHDGVIEGTVGGGAFEKSAIEVAIRVIETRSSERYKVHLTKELGMCCGGLMEVFVEPIVALEHLVIYGAGHVGSVLAKMAVELDFQVTVVDEREEWIDEDRFPPKVNTVFADPVHAIGMLPFGQYCYHFITTHSHSMDQDILNQIHDRELRWLGMIGSQAKKYRFIKRMVASGVDPSVLEHLNTPAGLDIGAETPAEIAISVLADLVRHRRMK